MDSGCGWSRVTNRSRENWASQTSRCALMRPSSVTGSWSFAHFRFVGGRTCESMAWHPSMRRHRRSPCRRMWGKKEEEQIEKERPPLAWPVALRQVHSWLDPWIMLWRFWRAWSNAPPPPQLRALLDAVGGGHSLDVYVPI